MLDDSTLSSVDPGLQERCDIVPCASQSIGEIGQIFSLLVPLPLFLYVFGSFMYEFDSRMVRVVRKGAEFYNTCAYLGPYEDVFKEELGGVVKTLKLLDWRFCLTR